MGVPITNSVADSHSCWLGIFPLFLRFLSLLGSSVSLLLESDLLLSGGTLIDIGGYGGGFGWLFSSSSGGSWSSRDSLELGSYK